MGFGADSWALALNRPVEAKRIAGRSFIFDPNNTRWAAMCSSGDPNEY